MRKILYSMIALLGLCLITGCESDEKVSPEVKKLAGEWRLTTWNDEAPTDFEAYISFVGDRSFTIYQKFETVFFQRFTGTFSLKGSVLSGVYSDKAPWGSKYDIQIDDSGNKLTLTSVSGVKETSVYVRATIPADVKSGAVNGLSVRSAGKRLL